MSRLSNIPFIKPDKQWAHVRSMRDHGIIWILPTTQRRLMISICKHMSNNWIANVMNLPHDTHILWFSLTVDGHVFITEDLHDVAIAVMSMWGQGGQLVDGGVRCACTRCTSLNSGYTPAAEVQAIIIVGVNAISETVTWGRKNEVVTHLAPFTNMD